MLGYSMKRSELVRPETKPLSPGRVINHHLKDDERDLIAERIEEFERKGGKIEQVESNVKCKPENKKAILSGFRNYQNPKKEA